LLEAVASCGWRLERTAIFTALAAMRALGARHGLVELGHGVPWATELGV
jgi:hypothetical protein